MKRNIMISVTLLLLLAPVSIMAQGKNKDTATVKFETSIECEDCVNTIMTNIPFEKGVKDVKCDLTTKEVTIVYHKNKTKPELLKRSLEKLGYTAKDITGKEKKTT